MQAMIYILLLLVLICLLFSAYTFFKVKNLHLLLYKTRDIIGTESLHLFRQIECLSTLYRELELTNSLPNTRAKAGSPDFLARLLYEVKDRKPDTVVECGSGISTIIIAKALQRNGTGHLYTLEHMPEFAEVTRKNLELHDLDNVTVIDAPLRDHKIDGKTLQWYTTDQLPDSEIDIVVIDGPPARTGRFARYPAGPLLFNKLSPKGLVLADDAARANEQQVTKRWTSEFPDMAGELNFTDYEKGLFVMHKGRR